MNESDDEEPDESVLLNEMITTEQEVLSELTNTHDYSNARCSASAGKSAPQKNVSSSDTIDRKRKHYENTQDVQEVQLKVSCREEDLQELKRENLKLKNTKLQMEIDNLHLEKSKIQKEIELLQRKINYCVGKNKLSDGTWRDIMSRSMNSIEKE